MSMPTLRVGTAKEEESWGQKGGTAGFGQRRVLPPSLSTALPGGVQGLGPGATAIARTRGQPFPPRAGWQFGGRGQKQVLPRTPSRRL